MSSQPRPVLIRDPRFREHVAPRGHPERPERLDAIDAALGPLLERFAEGAPRPAADEEILRVHDRAHLDGLVALEGRAGQLDPDTYVSPRSVPTARLAAGSAVDLALRVGRGEAPAGFALIRPPGHHAEARGAMGFCLLNQVAIAARALRAELEMERIAIVDWDVHHGNGTQHIFEDERDTLFVSTHQFPFYPGTGALGERGRGQGEGSTVNLPLPAGAGDAEYAATFEAVILPILREFEPEIVLVSAGFDAHRRDPLASMQVSTEGFRRMARDLVGAARELCDGRIVLALEGGYDLDALGSAVAAVAEELAGGGPGVGARPKGTPLSVELTAKFRDAHGPFWASARPS